MSGAFAIPEGRELGELCIRILDPEQASILGEEAKGFAVGCLVGIARMQIATLADAHEAGKFCTLLGADGNSTAGVLLQSLDQVGIDPGRIARLDKPIDLYTFNNR